MACRLDLRVVVIRLGPEGEPYEVRAIPIPNRTLPVDLLWRAGSDRRAVLTAVKVARELHRRYPDARNLATAGLT